MKNAVSPPSIQDVLSVCTMAAPRGRQRRNDENAVMEHFETPLHIFNTSTTKHAEALQPLLGRGVLFMRITRRRDHCLYEDVVLTGMDIARSCKTLTDANNFLHDHVACYAKDKHPLFIRILWTIYARVIAYADSTSSYYMITRCTIADHVPFRRTKDVSKVKLMDTINVLGFTCIADEVNDQTITPVRTNPSTFQCRWLRYETISNVLYNPLSDRGRAERAKAERYPGVLNIHPGFQFSDEPLADEYFSGNYTAAQLDAIAQTEMATNPCYLKFVEHARKLLEPANAYTATLSVEQRAQQDARIAEAVNNLLLLIATIIQNCETQRVVTVLTSVVKQCGKGTLMDMLALIVGNGMLLRMPSSIIDTRFHSVMRDALILFIDEADKKLRDGISADLKEMAGGNMRMTEGKGTNAELAPWRPTLFLATNTAPISNGESREFRLMSGGNLAGNTKYFLELYNTFTNQRHIFMTFLIFSRMKTVVQLKRNRESEPYTPTKHVARMIRESADFFQSVNVVETEHVAQRLIRAWPTQSIPKNELLQAIVQTPMNAPACPDAMGIAQKVLVYLAQRGLVHEEHTEGGVYLIRHTKARFDDNVIFSCAAASFRGEIERVH